MTDPGPIVVCVRHWVRNDPPEKTYGRAAADPSIFEMPGEKGGEGDSASNAPMSAQIGLGRFPQRAEEWDELSAFLKATGRWVKMNASPFKRTWQTAKNIRARWFSDMDQGTVVIDADPGIQEVGGSACKLYYGPQGPAISCLTCSWINDDDIPNEQRPVYVHFESLENAFERFNQEWDAACRSAVANNTNIILITHGEMVSRVATGLIRQELYSIPELSYVAFAPRTQAVAWSNGLNEGTIDARKTLSLDVSTLPPDQPVATHPGYALVGQSPTDDDPANRCSCVLL